MATGEVYERLATLLLFEQMLAFVTATEPRFPLTDWYDTGSAAYAGFSARAQVRRGPGLCLLAITTAGLVNRQVGGLFSAVWMHSLRQKSLE